MLPEPHTDHPAAPTSSSDEVLPQPAPEHGLHLDSTQSQQWELSLQSNLNAINKIASLVPSLRVLIGLSIAALIIVGLYFGRDLLIPLALATLFGFLLNPAVSWLKTKGVPRLAGILMVITVALGILMAGAAYLGMQLGNLSQELPTYQNTIRSKLQNLKTFSEGPSVWDGAISTFTVIKQTLSSERPVEHTPANKQQAAQKQAAAQQKSPSKQEAAAAKTTASDAETEAAIHAVRIAQADKSPIDEAITWLQAIANPIATAGIVLLFVILILLDRSDLRDRILRLLGSNLNSATDTLDEAAARIGTYLRMQLIVNLSYGIPMALGLWLIGVPAAILWGMVAVVMRFVPYVGPMLSSIFPLLLAFAVDPTWNMVLWTLGLIVVLELVSNNIIEPMLYGSSTGLSTLAIILAATFWTALWGPIGLILSTPLTACILVLARSIPSLKFIEILLGNAPVLDAPQRFYQRLLADNVEEALELAHADIEQDLPAPADVALVARKVTTFYDEVSIPAMRLFSNMHNDVATAEHRLRINSGLKQFVHEMRDEYPIPVGHAQASPRVLCVAARWEVDSKASDMLLHSLQLQGFQAEVLATPLLLQLSNLDQTVWQNHDVVCVSLFNPQPMAAARLLCRHIHKRWPHLRIIIVAWNADAHKLNTAMQQRFGVEVVVNTIQELSLHLQQWQRLDPAAPTPTTLPDNESERLAALRRSAVLQPPLLPLYAEWIQQARSAFDTADAQISWVDADWIYTPASSLLPPAEHHTETGVAREHSVCTYVVQHNEALVIADTARDPRFAEQTEFDHQRVRFYAGVPLRDKDGWVLGSLCVMDDEPRQISAEDLQVLQTMADDLMQTLRKQGHSDA
ncbi:AI-2E family transporter [Vitreoscilla massiliensis]|uniref:AI-2E family transporter n=1 Tax=Vitreoscilla massiliensis TaxID=1689272 RepID=A0ABY4E385_9NEIS|nr:AI-2E family transporter [Vitreoscilla massiliensis]UOO89969.1 AI-2E family transporter [Vitreoscilla massiliensis]